jgi:membrane-associated phospholipid phosphatase
VGAYLLGVGGWLLVVGPPVEPIGVVVVFCGVWFATIAWNIHLPVREHLGFLRDWWLPTALLVAYMYSRALADELGLPVHVTSAIRFDEWLFGGTLPTAALQDAWCGEPCRWASHGAWYDTVFAVVYYSYFAVGLTVAIVLWLRNRSSWLAYLRRFIGLNLLALVGYVAFPLAPPWWASKAGYLDEPVQRLTIRGLDNLGLHSERIELGPYLPTGNAVAAMPSLHTATAMLVALYGITRLRHPARWLLLAYPALMSVTLVYTGEHYVVDVLAGYLSAGLVMLGASAWERWRAARSAERAPEYATPGETATAMIRRGERPHRHHAGQPRPDPHQSRLAAGDRTATGAATSLCSRTWTWRVRMARPRTAGMRDRGSGPPGLGAPSRVGQRWCSVPPT